MSKNGKILQFDRNKAAGPWQPMVQIQLTEEAIKTGVAAGYQNNKARVFVKRTASSGFMIQGPDGQAQPMPIIHLIIAGLGGRKLDFAEIQRIKNELVHEESDAVELYPGKNREIDSPQTHLWCLPPGYTMPVGLVRAAPVDPNAEVIPGSRIKREDLLFYSVTTQAEGEATVVVEVFASEDDARACYDQASGTFVPGEYLMYGMVPNEEEGAAWSPKAVERRAGIQALIEAAGVAMAASQGAPGHNPTEDEMREGIATKAAERDAAMAEVEASGDDEAKAALAAMREELVRTGGVKVIPDGKSD